MYSLEFYCFDNSTLSDVLYSGLSWFIEFIPMRYDMAVNTPEAKYILTTTKKIDKNIERTKFNSVMHARREVPQKVTTVLRTSATMVFY